MNREEIILEKDDLEDYNTVEVEGDDSGEEYPNLSIKIEKAQFSIFELKRRYDREKICIDPDFQREFVWDNRQKSELIESVIMGIPLPLIYLAENADGQLIVVDGRQRLTTFFDFLDNKFKLKGLRILPQLNNMNISAMEEDKRFARYVSVIEDTQLVVQIIKYPTKDRVRFDIFDRVNRGGTPLNKQEMRNALYQGKSTEFLQRLAALDSFQWATGGAVSPRRMKDRYIILRAVCFYLYRTGELFEKDGKPFLYRSDMEELLGTGMRYLNAASDEEIKRLEQVFDSVMRRAYFCFGEDVFRIPTEGKIKRPVSMTLFESLFWYFTLVEEKELYTEASITGVEELLTDEEYLDSLQYSVDRTSSVETRFRKVEDKIKEISDAQTVGN